MYSPFSCKQREIEFEFKPKEATPPHTCAASATILGVTVEAEGKSVHDVHCKIAIKMLAKLGWDTADIEEMSIDSTLKPDVSHKKEDQLNSSVTTEVSEDNAVTRNSLLSPAQQQLQNLYVIFYAILRYSLSLSSTGARQETLLSSSMTVNYHHQILQIGLRFSL